MVLIDEHLKSNYYSQCEQHLQAILQSRLILDEDMDCILAHYDGDEFDGIVTEISLVQKAMGTLSLAGTLLLIYRRGPLIYVPVSASPVLVFGLQCVREMLQRRTQKQEFEVLIKSVTDNAKLLRVILHYFRCKKLPGSATPAVPCTKSMQQLVEMVSKEQIPLLCTFRTIIKVFGKFVPAILTEYACLDTIDFNTFTTSNLETVQDCKAYIEKLYDIYVLFCSNCLTGLALMFCPRMWRDHKIDVDYILDFIVPQIKSASVDCYDNIHTRFYNVKDLKTDEMKVAPKKTDSPPTAPKKMRPGACEVIRYSSDILDKSQIVVKLLQEEPTNLNQLNELVNSLDDLRYEVFGFLETLDVYQKHYYFTFKQTKSEAEEKPADTEPVVPPVTESKCEIKDASLNPSEPSDDEEFELNVPATEILSEKLSLSCAEATKYLDSAALLNLELQQKLKSHAKFIAARKKRGIVDEEPASAEVTAPVEAEIPPPPITVPEPSPTCDEIKPKPLLPPPPPPPMPSFNLGPAGDYEHPYYTPVYGESAVASYFAACGYGPGPTLAMPSPDSFVDAIKAAAEELKRDEDVFRDNNEN